MMQEMHSGNRTWQLGGLLLIAGLGLRLLFLRFHPNFAGDAMVYKDIANNLLAHHVYGLTTDGKVTPTLIRLPGYPAFLAICFAVFHTQSFLPAVWVQILASLLDAALLGSLARRLWGARAGMVVLGVAVLCPFTANYSVVPLTETWSLFCVSLGFFSLERWAATSAAASMWNRWLPPLALACAFAVLLRPDRVLLVAVLVPAMFFMAKAHAGRPVAGSLGPAAIVAAIVAAPLLVWGARNWRVFHVIQPLAPKYANDPGEPVTYGFNRWYRTWAIDFKSTADVYWEYDGSLLRLRDLPARAFDNHTQQDETAQVYRRYNEASESSPEIERDFARLAEERVAAQPLRYYVLLPAARLADMWLRPRTELLRVPVDWWNWQPHPWRSFWALGYALLNVAYLTLAAMGMWRWRRSGWHGQQTLAPAMVAFVLLRCALLLTLDNSEQRYTMDCYPIVLLLAGLALVRPKTSEQLPSPSC